MHKKLLFAKKNNFNNIPNEQTDLKIILHIKVFYIGCN